MKSTFSGVCLSPSNSQPHLTAFSRVKVLLKMFSLRNNVWHFLVRKSHHLPLLGNCFCPQNSVVPVDQFPDVPFSKYTLWSRWRGHRTHEAQEGDGEGGGALGPASLHLAGWLRASEKPPQSTKLALCKISTGHQEGLTALFS